MPTFPSSAFACVTFVLVTIPKDEAARLIHSAGDRLATHRQGQVAKRERVRYGNGMRSTLRELNLAYAPAACNDAPYCW